MTQQQAKKMRSFSFYKTVFISALLASSALTTWQVADAQVTSASSSTQVYTAPNGVTVVDIANPNAAGLSHNTYTNYNVAANGLVLNNGNVDQMARQSQLAGQVMANMNLTKEASLILNEVVSTNRSTLSGYTEVLGRSADVIVANPYGITCNGCGFINAPNVTLTTGTPQIAGSGALAGFRIDNGDILITGDGLDGSAQNYLALLARTVKLESQINAKDLDIVAGTNDWDSTTKTAAARAPTGAAPVLAIDSSALGGMYANRIRLIATEAGVGVKMLGEASAGVGDFTLTSSGKIEIGNAVSAERDVKITTTASGSNALKTTDARISSKRDTALSATSGEVYMQGGSLTAVNDLTITSASLTDEKTTNGSYADNNKRFGGNSLTLTQTGASSFDGTAYGTDGDLTVTADSLTVNSNGATFYADGALAITTANNMALNNALLKSGDDLNLIATSGLLTTTTGGAIQSTGGAVNITAGNGFTNGAAVSSDTAALTLRIGNALTNSGTLHAKTALDIADTVGGKNVNITNTGNMLAETTLNIFGNALTNTGGIIQGAKTSVISLLGQLTNSGKIILSSTAAFTGTVVANAIDNLTNGVIQSADALIVNVTSFLTNATGAKIMAVDDLTVRGTGATYNVNNSGLIQSGDLLSIKGAGNNNAVNIYGVGSAGSYLGNTIDFNAYTLNLANGSGITSNGNMTLNTNNITLQGINSYIVASNVGHAGLATINTAADLSNYGFIYSGGNLTIDAGSSIYNYGTGGIAAYNTANLSALGNYFYNYGALYAGSLLDISSAYEIWNTSTGTMDSGLDMTANAQTFKNNNDINATRNLMINVSSTFYNELVGGDQRAWSTYNDDVTTNTGWSSNPSGLIWGQSANRYYTRTWYDYQYYVGGTPGADAKARLIANGTLTITGFQYARNLGSIISAPTVNISSTQVGAVFVNDDYSLKTENYTRTWRDHVSCCSDVIYLDYTYGLDYNTVLSSSSATSFGAGIYAGTLSATGFSLTNAGSAVGASVDSASKSGATSTATVSGTTFGGITITLPSNPNGYFVISKDPNSEFLIETNPRYGVGSSAGSKYMIERLGLDPDTLQKRLGDGNYEASLIRDQLTSQTGTTVLIAGETEAAQMQRLMDNGVDQGKSLGLTYGVAPSPDQIAGLQQDMVWMVETEVAGQKVLAPVVYLSAATKAALTTGAVIAANDVHMNLTSLTNTGGTISGSKTLDITSQGDITNTSGTIKGGDVNLQSTEGSIINETYAKTTGNDDDAATIIGKKGGIEATGNLNMDAKKDIKNKGADITAGGDASLKAGENIVFDTIEDKKASTTHSSSGNSLFNGSEESHTSGSTTNIGSNLKVGGNLKTDSGKDTVIRGSTVDVGGDADLHAAGDMKILDAQDVTYTKDSKTESGLGVGGGVYGTEKTDDTHTKKTSVGSSINIGGNGKISSDKTMTVQGSDITTQGDLDLKAKDIKVLEGRNEETTTHSKSTTTFLKVEDSESNSASDSGSSASSGTDGDKASADAEAHASAEANGSGGVTAVSTETNTTNNFKSTGKASNIKSGGNMKIESENDTLIRGSNVEAAGDVELKGKNINIEASRDIDTTTTTNSKTSIGLYGDSANKAEANADAGAHADGGGASANANGSKSGAGAGYNAGEANADAGAHAGANASSNNTLDIMRTSKSGTTTTDVTHQGSSIKSGGKMKITADEQLNVKGSDIEAGEDLDLEAKDMTFTAVEDSHTTSSNSSNTSVGLYADADADASAGVDAGGSVKDMNASAKASAEANANAGIGLQGTNTTESSVEGSTTAKTSTIKSGGNMTRKAENKITDEGTQIEAGGDFTQESKEWESKAAKDTTFSGSDSETNTARFGLYGEANAGAEAGADAREGVSNESGAGASAGVKATYNRETSGATSGSSTAVTSTIKSGGNMKTTTTGKTSLEGTNLESDGDMELNAGSLDYKAARDTETSSEKSSNIDAELKVGIDATKAVTGTIAGGYEADRSTDSSSKAVTGSMKSGGNLKVNTKDDARFEGTNIEAEGDAAVKAGGNLTFDAARDTESHTGGSENASASISASKSKGGGAGSKGAGLEAEGGLTRESSSSSDAVTGSIKSGGKLDLSAGKNATFEGTELESGSDMSVDAKGDVNFNAAKSTSTEESYGAQVGITASKGGKDDTGKKKGSSGAIEAEGSYNKADSSTSTAGSLKSGGKINVKSGNDVTLEGTNIESEDKTSIDAKRDVNFKATEDTSSSVGFEASLSGEKTKAAKGGDASENSTTAGGGFALEGGKSSTKTGGSIKAGEIDIKAGGDATLEGTSLDSKGDTSLKAGNNINLKAAESSSIEGNVSTTGNANIGGGVQKDGVQINSGGDLKIESGKDTTMEGTKANVDGKADIKAGGDIKKKTTVSGSGQIGTTSGGASIDVQGTEINAGQGVTEGR